ncbi:hypothetical protein BH11PSE2_BH11PSE2_09080 [soil metagenome]
MLGSIERRPLFAVVAITAFLFFWITGNGVLAGGYAPDDWLQMHSIPPKWGNVEGRWAMDLLYRFAFRQRFLEPLQLLLAYGCFLYIAVTLARAAAPEKHFAVAAIGIFLIGVNHPYMTDVLNFSAHIFAYPFALALSVAAFYLAVEVSRGKPLAVTAGLCLAGMVLMATAAGLYQPFVIFGLIIPALALLRTDRYSDKDLLAVVAKSAVLIIGTGLAYVIALKLFVHLDHRTVVDSRSFAQVDASTVLDKIAGLPTFLRKIYNTSLQPPTHTTGWLYYPLILVLALVSGAAILLTGWNERRQGLVTVLAGGARRGAVVVGVLLVLPAAFWLIYTRSWFPGRAMAYLGLSLATLLVAYGSILEDALKDRLGALAIHWAVLAPLLAASLASLFLSSVIWDDQKVVVLEDNALATAIYSRISAVPGFDGKEFVVVGDANQNQMRWGGELGYTSIGVINRDPGIFNRLLLYPGIVDKVTRGPLPCSAFPANDSVYLYQGRAFICLEKEDGLFPLDGCIPVSQGGSVTSVCPKPDGVVFRSSCEPRVGAHFMRVRKTPGGPVETEPLDLADQDFYRDGVKPDCYHYAKPETPVAQIVSVGQVGEGKAVLWEQALTPVPATAPKP